MTVRIAMWSGPRNISTAMMRAFENRDDTVVVDEPFYAYYLNTAGKAHPMGGEIIESQPTDWKVVANAMVSEPCDARIFYQKHMTHHMLSDIDLSWTKKVQNCFLIRDPKYVVHSYAQKMSTLSQRDIGVRRQYELYEEISKISGQDIPVIDSRQFLSDPESNLRDLCEKLSIPFTSAMLQWPRGRRESDGIWASHWYEAVENSTGFQPFTEPHILLSPEQQHIVDEADKYYQMMLQRGSHG